MSSDIEREREDLDCVLVNEDWKPVRLSYGVLKAITHDFCHELGSGGFGKVYRGFLPSGDIAVKDIHIGGQFNDNLFQEEVECLTKANHKNIVRILGYCSETHRELVPYNGGYVWADIPKRLLCFEYVPNGNLAQYLKDKPKVDQRFNRFQLLKGICEGLHFLHEIGINHLDLKPDNVLLDANMEPKITDFGLSRFINDKVTTIVTKNTPGTLGYMAPEVIVSQELSLRADIYSLGIIMKQVITGYNKIIDLEKCDESLYLDDPGMKECMEIAERSVQIEHRRRPTIRKIIDDLNEIEKKYKLIPVTSRPLEVGPLELHSPFRLDRTIPCSLKVANKTDELVAFRLTEKGIEGSSILILPLYGIVLPNKTILLELTTKNLEQKPCKQGYSTTLQTTTIKDGLAFDDSYSLERHFLEKDKERVILTSQVIVKTVFRLREVSTSQDVPVKDMIDIHPRELQVPLVPNKHIPFSLQLTNKTYEHIAFKLEEKGRLNIFDMHSLVGVMLPRSTCTLVLTTKKMKDPPEWLEGHLILQCVAQKDKLSYRRQWEIEKIFAKLAGNLIHKVTVKTFCGSHMHLTPEVRLSIKMLYSPPQDLLCFDINPHKQWIITGYKSGYVRIWHYIEEKLVDFVRVCEKEGAGFIRVYDYEKKIQKIKEVKASEYSVTSVAIHPTETYVLSSGDLGTIKLWDWEQDWEPIRTFQEERYYDIVQIAFNPMDTNSFASACGSGNSFWELSSVGCLYSLPGHSKKVNCLDYFTIGDQQHMITGSDDQTAKIWNLEDATCVKTLDAFTSPVSCVSSHSNMPVIITGTENGTVTLWSSSTWRIVIVQERAVSWLTIDNMDYQDVPTMSHEHQLCISPRQTMASKISPVPCDLLGVQPKLHFHVEGRDHILYSVLYLTSKVDERVAFRLKDNTEDQMCFLVETVYGILEPRSTQIHLLGMKKNDPPQKRKEIDLILQNCIYGDQHVDPIQTEDDYDSFLKDVKEMGLLQEITLTAVFGLQEEKISEVLYMLPLDLRCCDVNPLRQWILIGDDEGFVRIWNYQTQKLVESTRIFDRKVCFAKFILQKQFFVVGSGDQLIHVFNYERGLQKITELKDDNQSIFSLVVHPTQPYALSSGISKTWRTCDSIKLWDWSNGWPGTCTSFESNGESPVAFNPVNAHIFARATNEKIQIWHLNCDGRYPRCTLSGHFEKVNCLEYFTCGDLQYLVSGSEDHTAKVWDLEENRCVQTLHAFRSPVTSVGSHPNLPILITGSKDGTVVLWCSSTFRVEKVLNLSYFGEVRSLRCVMDSGRIFIGQEKAISLLTMDNVDFDESSRELCVQKLSVGTAPMRTDVASEIGNSPSALLDVQQLECHFRLEHSKPSCALLLNNKTNERVAFRLMEMSGDSGYFETFPWCGIMQPRSTFTLIVTTTKIEAPEEQEFDLVVQSCVYGDQHIYPLETKVQYNRFFIDVKELGRVIHEVTLKAMFMPQGKKTSLKAAPDGHEAHILYSIQQGLEIISLQQIGPKKRYFDVSPTGPWIITETDYDCADIHIWNCDTEGPLGFVSLRHVPLGSGRFPLVLSAKFIARKQWFLAGDENGFLHVYSYATNLQNIKSFRTHKGSVYALAVHPTKPYVLTAGLDGRIKLWNWDNSWACKKEIKVDPYDLKVDPYDLKVNPVVLNPMDTSNFASASGLNTVQIWSLDSASSTHGWSQYYCLHRLFDSGEVSTYILRGHSGTVLCLDYFSSGGRQYLITGSEDHTVKIWDLKANSCVRTLDALCAGAVTAVRSHPSLPILITGSEDGTVRFWCSTTFSLEKVLNFGLGEPVVGIGFTEDLRRLVIWYVNHIARIDVNVGNSAASTKGFEGMNKSETEK